MTKIVSKEKIPLFLHAASVVLGLVALTTVLLLTT